MKNISDLLKEYRADCGGTLIQNTLPGLYDLINYVKKEIKDIVMIEIGSFEGVSTELFAMTCKKVYAVDGWGLAVDENNYDGIPKERLEKAEKIFRQKMSSYNNVEIIKSISANAHQIFGNGKYDLIYIDGDHKEQAVYEDIKYWLPKVKKGGFISGHDYSNIYMVRNAVNAHFGQPDKTFTDCSWIKKCI